MEAESKRHRAISATLVHEATVDPGTTRAPHQRASSVFSRRCHLHQVRHDKRVSNLMLSSLSRTLIARQTAQISKLPTTLALMSTAATNGSAAGAGPGLGPARNKRSRHRGRGGQGKKELSTAASAEHPQPAAPQNARFDQPGRARPPHAPPVPAPRPALAPVGVDEAAKAMQNQLSDVSFSSFVGQGLSPDMLKRIPYQYCSPVQAATLKPILEGKDV
jgi:hypothetical protein